MMRALVLLGLGVAGPAWAGAWQGVSFGIGAASGYDLKWDKVCASPMLSIGVDVGSPVVSGWFGIDSAPTYLMALGYDVAGIPLAMATIGVTGGGEKAQFGAYGTVGFVGVGGGVRVRLFPWQDRAGGRHGFDIRADWLAPLSPRASVLYTWRPSWGVRRDDE